MMTSPTTPRPPQLALSTLLLLALAAPAPPGWAAEGADPYDALYDIMMVRTTPDGKSTYDDPVAPMLWPASRYLIQGETYGSFLKALDAFGALSPEELRGYSTVRRALLQRNLWAVFDWLANLQHSPWIPESAFEESRQFGLQAKLAPLIRRLALTPEEIQGLPDTVAATAAAGRVPERPDPANPLRPFFPRDLLGEASPWVCLEKSYHRLPAKVHTESAQWRSAFLVFIRLPGDREATLAYLRELTEFRDHWVTEKPEIDHRTTPNGGINYVDIFVNPETPQFPVGTQVALAEQALLISDAGEIVPSPLTISVQLRAFLRMEIKRERGRPPQAFAQFIIRPRQVMEGTPAMRALGVDEHFPFGLLDNDPFESKGSNQHRRRAVPNLQSCITCHSAWGIHSLNSRSQLFEHRSLLPPRFREGKPERVTAATASLKQKDYTWGLLQGLWRPGP